MFDENDPKLPLIRSLGLDRDIQLADVGDLDEVRGLAVGEPFDCGFMGCCLLSCRLLGRRRAGLLREGPEMLIASQFIGLIRADLQIRQMLRVDDLGRKKIVDSDLFARKHPHFE
jgi:hypothetical protein